MADQIVLSTSNAGMVDYPIAIQATGGDPTIGYSAQDLMRATLHGVFRRSGIVTTSALGVSQRSGGATFGVDVAAGQIVVPGTSITGQGKYLCTVTSTVQLPTPTAPASGTRTHRIVAEVLDKQVTGSAYGWRLRLVEDTGTGLPAAPANSETIATVSIAAAQASVLNAHITDVRAMAHASAVQTTVLVGNTAVGATEAALLSVAIPSPITGHNPTQKYRIEVDAKYLASSAARTCWFRLRADNATSGTLLDATKCPGVNTVDYELARLNRIVTLTTVASQQLNWFYATTQTSASTSNVIDGASLTITPVS